MLYETLSYSYHPMCTCDKPKQKDPLLIGVAVRIISCGFSIYFHQFQQVIHEVIWTRKTRELHTVTDIHIVTDFMTQSYLQITNTISQMEEQGKPKNQFTIISTNCLE